MTGKRSLATRTGPAVPLPLSRHATLTKRLSIMAKSTKTTAPPLIDAVRPMDADGPLVSLICSTYGLALDQPNFFEQDFLPTLLGLGGVRDRGYAVPVAMERKLKDVYSALVAEAHELDDGGVPSLQFMLLLVG